MPGRMTKSMRHAQSMPGFQPRPGFIILAAACIIALVLARTLMQALTGPLVFDDAFMFHRYADHLRQGMGAAWNPGGEPTYGVTSHGWLLVIWGLNWMDLRPEILLQLASWLAGVAGLAIVARAVVRPGGSRWAMAIALGGIAWLLLAPGFRMHLTTGMDTMLAFAASAAIAGMTVDYAAQPSQRLAAMLGIAAFLAFLVRPDSGLCAIGAPLLVWLLHGQARRYPHLLGLLALPLLLIGGSVLLCLAYYGLPLPLGFYAKSAGSYEGFQGNESAIAYLIDAIAVALPFLVIMVLVPMRSQIRIAFLTPVLITLAYLLTVNQVMGWSGRFYMPLLPYLVVPALLSLDAWAADPRRFAPHAVLASLLLAIGCLGLNAARDPIAEAHVAARRPAPIAAPHLIVDARRPLTRLDWFTAISRFSDDVAARLPAGTVMAASEVGYLGRAAPHVAIIDLVGLNDTEIGRNGVDVDRLIDRAPDLIWMPHDHYTGMRARLLSSPRFHARYLVIAGAYNYGIALRRDSPRRTAIEQRLRQAWPKTYPGERLDDYIVHR